MLRRLSTLFGRPTEARLIGFEKLNPRGTLIVTGKDRNMAAYFRVPHNCAPLCPPRVLILPKAREPKQTATVTQDF